MTAEFIFTMRDLRRFHPPDREVLRGINISMFPGAKIGVLGSNGSGKSSLLRIMAGEDDGYTGEARLTPGFTVGFLPQEPTLDPTLDVGGNVALGVGELKGILDRYNEVCDAMGAPDADFDKLLEEQGELAARLDTADGWDLDRTLEIAMDALQLPPSDADVTTLSGGERRRVALCRLLLSRPDLLLLDEPTNHLDAESVAWLERTLRDYVGTVVAVTHDRYFLDNVAGWILELDRGAGIPWEGNYSSWLEQKHGRLAGEAKADERRKRTLERELEWIRMSPRARQAKGKARLNAYEAMVAEAEGAPERADKLEIVLPPGPRLGDVVIEATDLTKGFGDRLLIDGLSFSLPPNGIVGVIGPNGAGKTTLFRMITGQDAPDGGSLRIGPTVSIAYVDQSRETLNAAATVYEEITGGVDHLVVGGREIHGRAFVSSFNFKGSDQQKQVGELSGGERNRVHLAKTLVAGGNVLLLDEPTNDLDVDTLRALEEALLDFAGCAVVVSHDRWFLDRIATHVLAFEGDSQVVWFEGNFSDYETDRHKRLGHDADTPHRVKYKPLVRRLTDRMRTRAIRIVVIVVCVLGVAGMIIASATNHNGAAVTFGLITAVAILCQMAMTTAVNEARGVPGAPITAIGSSPPPSPPPNPSSGPPPNPSSSPSSAPPAAPGPALDPVDTEAAALESRIADLVAAGVEEQAVRDLARQAVRLGRLTSPSGPPDS